MNTTKYVFRPVPNPSYSTSPLVDFQISHAPPPHHKFKKKLMTFISLVYCVNKI